MKEQFLAVVGASGSGKSSLIRAGLVPALRWNKTSADWISYIFTPTEHPLESLASTLTQENGLSVPTLARAMAQDSRGLQEFVPHNIGSRRKGRLLLVVDQFEELFTLCHSEEERTSFIENLLGVSTGADPSVMVIITLRADFYAACADYPSLREALAKHQEYIGAMNNEELRRAIEEPARRGRWEFEPGLIDLLLHDVGNEPGALPLLSHALLETWQRRRGREMTMSGYSSSGGVRGAIAETAETVYTDQFTQEQQGIARRIFLRLTELNDEVSTSDTRRRASFNELILKPEEAGITHAVLNALADARLITTSENTAEVAHEALIREWPTLRGWLEENRDGLRLHRQLTEAAQEWNAMSRSEDMLFRGLRLAQVQGWAKSHAFEMNVLEHDFLAASQAWADQESAEREAQRQRELEAAHKLAETQTRTAKQLRHRAVYLIGVLVSAVVAALIAGIYASQNAANLTRSEAQRLAAEANSLIQSGADPQLIALLSIKSIQTEGTLEGDTALSGTSMLALPFKSFITPDNQVFSAIISPDGRYLLTVSVDIVQLWDVETGYELRRFGSGMEPIHAIFSPDGKYILTSGLSGIARLSDVETGQTIRDFIGHQAQVVSSDFSQDGRYAVTASLDKTAILWDIQTGEAIRHFRGHTDQLRGVAFSPNDELIVTVGLDLTVRLWNVGTGDEILKFTGHTQEITSVDFSSDGKTIVTGSHDQTVRIWDVSNGLELQRLAHRNRVNSVAFSPDGRTILTGSDDKTMRLWDIETGRELQHFSGQDGLISDVTFSQDGLYFTSGSFDGTVWLWNARQAFGKYPKFLHRDSVSQVVFSPDGSLLATAGADNLLHIWNVRSGDEILRFSGHSRSIYSVNFSPDGRYILSGSFDGTARLWDVKTGQTLQIFQGQDLGTSTVIGAAFLPDEDSVLTVTWNGMVKVWDRKSGDAKTSFTASPGEINGIAILPDGQSIVTASYDGMLRLWDIQSGKLVRVFPGHTDIVNGVVISSDGKFALSYGFDKVARLWDIKTGEELQHFKGHTGILFGASFSPLESIALTAGGDGTVRLWDLNTGQELHRFTGHSGSVEWVAFSPDGKIFATASDDGTAWIWDVDYRDTIQYLCSHLLRDLTDEERVQYHIMDNSPTCPAQ